MFKRILPLFLTVLIFGVCASDLHASASKAIALTLKVTGDVDLLKEGADKTAPLKFGTPLDDGDRIKTGNDGFAILIFADDKSQIKLRPNTEVVINGKRDAQSNIAKRITMEVGEIFTRIDKQRGSFEVVTPTSVASVKGTEFWMVVHEDGTTEVLTIRGLIELMNRISGKIVDVSSGQHGISDPQGGNEVNPTNPADIPEEPEDRDVDMPHTLLIQVQDPDGRTRTIIIQYFEGAE
ncbi:FecR domain-containing protein [bacterium]|nr:FecR domain-containing protein [bacterium]